MKKSSFTFRSITFSCLLTTIFYILISCGGGLTDEQRKKIKNEMETNRIKRVSEAEITEAAFAQGREILKKLDNTTRDSLATANKVKIVLLEPGQRSNREIENQLIEAYINNMDGGRGDNVQKLGKDSLLYTMPIVKKQADGVDLVSGIWSIYISRKQLVLGM